MPNMNTNYTSSAGVVPAAVQEYMNRTFLDRVVNNRVYGRDFQTRVLPLHNGKRVVFTKMSPFPVDVTPLKEGVTPDGQTIETSNLSATVKPYGQYVALTDEVDWALIDNFKREASLRLGDQAADTLDTIDKNAMACGTNVQYAGSKTSRSDLSSSTVLTYAEIKKAVRTLKKNKARRFPDGYYHAIISPDTAHDLTGDSMWVDVAKYQNSEKMEKGELGKMAGVKFYESTNPLIFESESYLYDKVASLALTGYDAAANVLSVAATTISTTSDKQELEYFVRRMSGKMINVYDAGTTSVNIPAVIDHIVIEGATVKIYLRWIGSAYTYASGDLIKPMGTLTNEVHGTIVYGQDFCGGVELAGGGKNIEMKIKPVGSSGTDDPLDQRSTMGWKVRGYTATILQDAFGVRIEHGVSA